MIAYFALIGFIPFAARWLLIYAPVSSRRSTTTGAFWRGCGASAPSTAGCRWCWRRTLSFSFCCGDGVVSALAAAGGIACLCAAALERDPRKGTKKPLAMTARARRIYIIAAVFSAALGWRRCCHPPLAIVMIVAVQLILLALVAANLLLAPFEAFVQRRYWRDAHEKLGNRSDCHCGHRVVREKPRSNISSGTCWRPQRRR